MARDMSHGGGGKDGRPLVGESLKFRWSVDSENLSSGPY